MSQFKSDQFENMSAAATHNFDLSLKKSVLKRFWRIFFFIHCLYMPEASLGLGLILKRSKVSMFNSQLISVRSAAD